MLQKLYQKTIGTDVKASCVWKNDQNELNETRRKLQNYLLHQLVINLHKTEKARRVCNAAANNQVVAFYFFPDENSSDSDRDCSTLPPTSNSAFSRHRSDFFSSCCPTCWQLMLTIFPSWKFKAEKELSEYKQHLFGAKNLPTCANYALHQMPKDNPKDHKNLVETVQRNFHLSEVNSNKKQSKSTKMPKAQQVGFHFYELDNE